MGQHAGQASQGRGRALAPARGAALILPALGNAWIGDLDLPELNATIRHLTLQDGRPASGSTKSTAGLGDVAMVLAFIGLRWEEAVAVRGCGSC